MAVSEDWHLEILLNNLYITRSVPWCKLSADVEPCCGPCALVQKAAGEGLVSEHHTVPVTPDVTAGQGLCSHKGLVFSQQTFPPGYFVVAFCN